MRDRRTGKGRDEDKQVFGSAAKAKTKKGGGGRIREIGIW